MVYKVIEKLKMKKSPGKCLFCGEKGITKLNGYEDLFFCGNCFTAFNFPMPNDNQLEEFYKNKYWESEKEIPKNVSTHSRTLPFTNIIKEYNSEAKTLCDVGCGYGALLKGFIEQGFEVSGLECSLGAVKFIKEKLKLNVTQGSIKDIKSYYDVINLRHVLEHSNNPWKNLENAIKYLNNNGLFIISVPNFNSLAAKILKPHQTLLTKVY